MSRYAPGSPSWFDLGSPDVAASVTFYTRLFGWTATEVSEPEAGGYTTFHHDGKLVAAVAYHQIDTPYHRPYGPDGQHGMPAIWTVYFTTDDADALTERVTLAGGEIIMTPMEVMGLGRMAVYADPAQAAFAVWQPLKMDGAEEMGGPGSVRRVELVTTDPTRSAAFYRDTLGLTAASGDWQVDGRTVGGTRELGVTGAVRPHWAVTFGVSEVEQTVRRAVELGGSVENPPADTPLGRRADLLDPHGAGFSVLS
ncbi:MULTISPECIES: VOC family protein [unclassified Nonomuraea]|uniref:VOC family protein n=1 Tax=unclassified Nonomuraea TaxID=2593643 RepID=UPI0035C24045